jgi:hypothetical protein
MQQKIKIKFKNKIMKQLFNNRILFMSFFSAIIFSFSNCGVSVDVKDNSTSGSVNLTINGLGALVKASGNQYVTVNFSGTVGTTTDGSGDPSFNVSQKFEIAPDGTINPGTVVSRINLQPGMWTITARANSWSSTCNGQISSKKAASFSSTYNSTNCTIQ